MKHWVIAYRRVSGPPIELRRRLRSDVADLLRTATGTDDGRPDPDGSILLQLPAHVVGLDLHKQVRVRSGVALDQGSRTCVPLQWEAEPARHAFPVFRGTIELEPLSATTSQLAVVGAVTPPLGPVGALADATVLGALAERTTHELADRLADALSAADVTDRGDDEVRAAAVAAAQLSVRDVMTPDPFVLDTEMPLKTAALLLFHFDVAGAPVQTDEGGLVGVLSESDLLAVESTALLGPGRRTVHARTQRHATTVGQACSRPAKVITPDARVMEAAGMMWEADVGRLVVVSGAEIVGIVSRHDVLRAVMRDDAETLAAVDRVLREQGEEDVMVHVEWGVATIKGSVPYHSTARQLCGAIRAVDGVVRVESSLKWDTDDLMPPVVP